jgi:alpha-galactosidase
LIDELLRAFPALEIETCASGGARADLGMPQRTSRVWVSDCNDPIKRQRIQRALLSFLPPEVMGVHIGDARSHTTGRVSDMPLRTLNALFGHMGIEADLLQIPPDDARHLKEAIAVYKTERHWLHGAQVSPIDHPDPALLATLALAADGQRAMIAVVAVDRTRDAVPAPLRVHGLAADDDYRVLVHPLWTPPALNGKSAAGLFQTDDRVALPGRALQFSGSALPILHPGSGVLVTVGRVFRI